MRDAIASNFESIRHESFRIEGLRWMARTDDLAVGVYEYHWSGEIGGEPMSGRGRGTTVLRRRGEGWEIVHEHLSRGSLEG